MEDTPTSSVGSWPNSSKATCTTKLVPPVPHILTGGSMARAALEALWYRGAKPYNGSARRMVHGQICKLILGQSWCIFSMTEPLGSRGESYNKSQDRVPPLLQGAEDLHRSLSDVPKDLRHKPDLIIRSQTSSSGAAEFATGACAPRGPWERASSRFITGGHVTADAPLAHYAEPVAASIGQGTSWRSTYETRRTASERYWGTSW